LRGFAHGCYCSHGLLLLQRDMAHMNRAHPLFTQQTMDTCASIGHTHKSAMTTMFVFLVMTYIQPLKKGRHTHMAKQLFSFSSTPFPITHFSLLSLAIFFWRCPIAGDVLPVRMTKRCGIGHVLDLLIVCHQWLPCAILQSTIEQIVLLLLALSFPTPSTRTAPTLSPLHPPQMRESPCCFRSS
jgi:hypothetical protein